MDNIKIYNIEDKLYPDKLRNISAAPKQLYVLGKLPDENKKSVAIVGARKASNYGRQMAYEYARVLACHDVQIISGMAAGIDASAHEGALAAGADTFAVLGSGADVCYPKSNLDIYNKIQKKGGIISEFCAGSEPLAWHFPVRNRIISGLSDIILVIEAREKSGSLITADSALEQGKDVFALPGRVDDELSKGCNRLIAQGAGIACNPGDILFALFNEETENQKDNFSHDNTFCNNSYQKNQPIIGNFAKKKFSGLAREEKTVYSCMRLQPKHINEIVKETGMNVEEVALALFSLEMAGAVTEVTKNWFAIDNTKV